MLEQACVVWNTSLTKKNERELERVQKIAVNLIIGRKNDYSESLKELNITTLKERRNYLSVNFAKKCLKSENTKDIFPRNISKNKMSLRNREHYKVKHCRTVRMQKSAVINMTKQLNSYMKNKENILKQ